MKHVTDIVFWGIAGSIGYQGQDHAWLGSQGKAGANDTPSGYGHHPYSKRRGGVCFKALHWQGNWVEQTP